MKPTTEKAFETYIQETMLGTSGWKAGNIAGWDREKGIFPTMVTAFIRDTQKELWEQLEKLHGDELSNRIIEALLKERAAKGTLHVLRHGFKFYGKLFSLAYFRPSHGLNEEIIELYKKNILTVTRQVPCHPRNNDTIDMVLSLNGIPVATCELKNPGTGQTWRDAIHQYKTTRDPRTPLFQYKTGALVHFAVDPQEVYMATRLREESTWFLPFNRGSHPGQVQCGAGNPAHPSGHPTAYLWEDVFARDSFMDIVHSFVFVETYDDSVIDEQEKKTRVTRDRMIFPRYHQLDAVRKLTAAAQQEGPGRQYLIQHSAGSGKTNSISWLSHRLSSLHNAGNQKIFDCVVVITDRKVLDRQLQDAIYQIEHAQGVVKAIDDNSHQLAQALIDGTKIVITTLQKFPFVLKGLLHIAGADDADAPDAESKRKAKEWENAIAKRRYAVIVDEAHSSQTGETARGLKAMLGAGTPNNDEDETEFDWEDGLNKLMESRGKQKNISFFAFTATPKGKTMEMFGRQGTDGKPAAFHTYSMRQAIQERFILDVLSNYTTYKTYYRLVKAAEEDPKLPKKKASKELSKFITLHPYNLEQKTEIIIEHFREHVKNLIGGKAKAMVIAGSRLHAVRYMQSFQRYIAENRIEGVRPLVAFSGTVKDPDTGAEYTEPGMNIDAVTGKHISESQLPDRFDTHNYQILLVANKYQTGFDQPLLCAMYVDRRLDGVQAVQTLSRLNRTAAGKEAPFVLDFVNEAQGIYAAFKPYYDATIISETSDPHQLELLKHDLDAIQIYHWSEVEAFARIFYLPQDKQAAADHARLQMHVQPAIDRFRALEDEEARGKFRETLSAFIRLYAFVSQVMPYADRELEMLYSYGRLLMSNIPDCRRPGGGIHAQDKVYLQYYRIAQTSTGRIVMEEGPAYGVKSPIETGTGKAKDEEKPLSEIIQVVNDRFGTDFTNEDQLFFDQIKEKACKDDTVIETAHANPLDKFEIGICKLIETFMIQRMSENDKIVTRYMDDEEFRKVVFPLLAKQIYKDIRT